MRPGYHFTSLLYSLLTVLIITITSSSCLPALANETDNGFIPLITADAAIVMDAGTGHILFEKNSNLKKPPASTTKIMTALLALEGGDLQDIVIVSSHAASIGEASLELKEGEMLTLHDLLYGAMLVSGNDACVAIAEHIGGTEANFVLLMNQKAHLLGACSTSFKNTNGLPATDHYTTAKDLATITRYALQNQIFKQIVGTRDIIINSNMGPRYLSNTNRLLWSYNGADGVKTGTTIEAGYCLVASATRDERTLISVVLDSDNRWKDTMLLLDYGFNHFKNLRIIDQGVVAGNVKVEDGVVDEVKAIASDNLDIVVAKGEETFLEKAVTLDNHLTAPVRMGQPVGRLTVKLKGKVLGSVELVSDREVHKLPNYRLFWRSLTI